MYGFQKKKKKQDDSEGEDEDEEISAPSGQKPGKKGISAFQMLSMDSDDGVGFGNDLCVC